MHILTPPAPRAAPTDLAHGRESVHLQRAVPRVRDRAWLALRVLMAREPALYEKLTHGGVLRGTWMVARYDAPIEWYAEQHARSHGTQDDLAAVLAAASIHGMPEHIRLAADALLKRDYQPFHLPGSPDEFENQFMTQGISTLWNQAGNGSGAVTNFTNSGAAVPKVIAYFNNAQAVIGVGDSSAAVAATQFDLQAAANRLWVAMDATFPTLPGTASGAIVFRSTFGTAQGNYAWQEFAVANDNGSNVTIPGSAARSAANGSMLDRVLSVQGTKAAGQTWQPSLTLTIA